MIELTEEQQKSIDDGKAIRVQANGRDYVVLRPDVYDRILDEGCEDSPWGAEEMDRLREESVSLLDSYGKKA